MLTFSFAVVYTFIPVQHNREGNDERQIEQVKAILIAMRKDVLYRQTKMRLLQKLTGIELLAGDYNDNNTERDWFKGYHVFQSSAEVMRKLMAGEALSCFCTTESNGNEVHVAFCGGENQEEISYLTIQYDVNDFTQTETGVHFCKFTLLQDDTTSRAPMVRKMKKKDLKPLICNYALMLPYMKKGMPFCQQFTLVYEDWEVLIIHNGEKVKGRTAVDWETFLHIATNEWIDK